MERRERARNSTSGSRKDFIEPLAACFVRDFQLESKRFRETFARREIVKKIIAKRTISDFIEKLFFPLPLCCLLINFDELFGIISVNFYTRVESFC